MGRHLLSFFFFFYFLFLYFSFETTFSELRVAHACGALIAAFARGVDPPLPRRHELVNASGAGIIE